MFKPIHVEQYRSMRDRADRIRAMIHHRAIRAYCAAFGADPSTDSHLDMCIIHNSLIAFDEGKPWREVNYSQMRLAARLCSKTFEPAAIVTRWYVRKSKG